MAQNKIVIHFQDGRILKGATGDFLPAKPAFHLELSGASPGTKPVEISIADLKAVFFVKDLAGNSAHREVLEFKDGKTVVGRKIQVEFKDGEMLIGTTQGYDPARAGFFVVPADKVSNNERCFVITRATRRISLV